MGMILKAEQLKDYLGVGDDVLRRFVADGLPCYWTGGSPGCGHRLFHRALVDEWLAQRMRPEPEHQAGTGPAPPTRVPARTRRGKAVGGGPIRTETGYKSF